jgi:hypothetical protein
VMKPGRRQAAERPSTDTTPAGSASGAKNGGVAARREEAAVAGSQTGNPPACIAAITAIHRPAVYFAYFSFYASVTSINRQAKNTREPMFQSVTECPELDVASLAAAGKLSGDVQIRGTVS